MTAGNIEEIIHKITVSTLLVWYTKKQEQKYNVVYSTLKYQTKYWFYIFWEIQLGQTMAHKLCPESAEGVCISSHCVCVKQKQLSSHGQLSHAATELRTMT